MTTAEPSASPTGKTITEHELEQCQRANQTGRQPVVFVHGLHSAQALVVRDYLE